MRLDVSLESYEAERHDFQLVLDAIGRIGNAAVEELLDIDWLHGTVCSVGLGFLTPPDVYADKSDLVNGSHQGIVQYPLEFARWLRLLADCGIATYLEVGCHNGGTACLAAAYLRRFNPDFRAVTIDLFPWFLFHSLVRDGIPLEYRVGDTSFAFRGQMFDAVFIDGHHSFPWAWADYENVGRAARVCGFHDIRNAGYRDDMELGGVPAVWELIRRTEAGPGIRIVEIDEHPGQVFGIGVRMREA
jgi:hypothetical protein